MTRARYLLEATVGNVGLASWLYWEDFLGGSNGGAAAAAAAASSGSGGGGGGSSDNGALSQKMAACKAKKSPEEADMDAIREANDHEESTDPGKITLNRKAGDKSNKSEKDDDDDDDEEEEDYEEDDRKPSSRSRDNEQEEPSANAERNNANPPAAAAAAAGFDRESSPHRNVNPAAAAAAALNAPPPPMAGRRRADLEAYLLEQRGRLAAGLPPELQAPAVGNLPPELRDLGLASLLARRGGGNADLPDFGQAALSMLRANNRGGVGENNNNNAPLLQDVQAELQRLQREHRANLPPGFQADLEAIQLQAAARGALPDFQRDAAAGPGAREFHRFLRERNAAAAAAALGVNPPAGNLPDLQAMVAAGGYNNLQAMPLVNPLAAGMGLSPRISDLVSRVFQGRELNEEERRDLIAALGIENLDFEHLIWLLRDSAGLGRRNAPAADAGGGGADDGDDSNNDSDIDEPQPDPFGANEPFGMGEAAPVRRSGRLRAQRNRQRGNNRGRRNNDAAGGVLAQLGRGVGRFRRPPNEDTMNDGGAVTDDDGFGDFVPGPNPVFRQIAAEAAESRSNKRKNVDELELSARNLLRGDECDDDNSSVLSDASSVDMNEFFSTKDSSTEPFDLLWADMNNDKLENERDDKPFIPPTWLRTGFALSDCGSGLAVPDDEEFEVARRFGPQILREEQLKSASGMFPHQCKSVSALLSIVTAMLYSGASIRGNTVTCDADRTPFDELTLEQRKREFPKRLIEALSALIFIASQSMSSRCLKALAKMDKRHAYRRKKQSGEEDVFTFEGLNKERREDEFTLNRLKLERRVHQCRVCSWEPDTANNDSPMLPRGRDPKDIRVHSSLTNIKDIKAYVRSHLRSFTEPGGCALFLETIARCHGRPFLDRLLSAKAKSEKPQDGNATLAVCKCKETLNYLEKKSKNRNLPDLLPAEHDCMSVELLSLLLTGQAHSSFKNWCADRLGFGLLMINMDQAIGPRLLHPVKPIWICLGDYGYSTLMLDKKNFIGNVNSLDEPGKAFTLAHWDCWRGKRTTMKVIPSIYDRPSRDHIIPAIIANTDSDPKRTVTESIAINMIEERERDTANPWSNNNIYSASPKQSIKPITKEELESIKFHPEDETLYPKEYRRWKYHVGNRDDWVSFHTLSGRQKLIVEMKLAPRICVLARTRWPMATVRDFSPEGTMPLV